MIWLLSFFPFANPLVVFLRRSPMIAGLANVVGVLLLVVLVFGAGTMKGHWDERRAEAARQAAAQLEAEKKKGKADLAATNSNAAAQTAITAEQERQNRADDALPDSRPSDVRLARYCASLSDADRAKVPRCVALAAPR